MDLDYATRCVLEGESIAQLSARYREDLLQEMGLDPEEAEASTFANDTRRFINRLCRQLGDRCAGDARVAASLSEWVRRPSVEDYDAFDALLSNFRFDGRELLLRKGRSLFPGTLTSHWDELDL